MNYSGIIVGLISLAIIGLGTSLSLKGSICLEKEYASSFLQLSGLYSFAYPCLRIIQKSAYCLHYLVFQHSGESERLSNRSAEWQRDGSPKETRNIDL